MLLQKRLVMLMHFKLCCPSYKLELFHRSLFLKNTALACSEFYNVLVMKTLLHGLSLAR